MTIGELDRRIIIEQPTVSPNSYGEVAVDSWIEHRTVWAKVEWDGGSETDETNKITATTKVNFYIRNLDLDAFLNGSTGPTMGYRINFSPQGTVKYYYIHNIEQIEGRERFLKIITEEKD
tara:strand:- start:1269 stop:1628 length:360 start_codon:yes stop_codon:yes gene_type:complete